MSADSTTCTAVEQLKESTRKEFYRLNRQSTE